MELPIEPEKSPYCQVPYKDITHLVARAIGRDVLASSNLNLLMLLVWKEALEDGGLSMRKMSLEKFITATRSARLPCARDVVEALVQLSDRKWTPDELEAYVVANSGLPRGAYFSADFWRDYLVVAERLKTARGGSPEEKHAAESAFEELLELPPGSSAVLRTMRGEESAA